MKDELIKLETAKLAKEKGFKFDMDKDTTYWFEPNLMWYFQRRNSEEWVALSNYFVDTNQNFQQYNSDGIDAPTQSLLQRWLREEHNIHISIRKHIDKPPYEPSIKRYYCPYIYIGDSMKSEDSTLGFEGTYEEALEEGLKNALNVINEEKEQENGENEFLPYTSPEPNECECDDSDVTFTRQDYLNNECPRCGGVIEY